MWTKLWLYLYMFLGFIILILGILSKDETIVNSYTRKKNIEVKNKKKFVLYQRIISILEGLGMVIVAILLKMKITGNIYLSMIPILIGMVLTSVIRTTYCREK